MERVWQLCSWYIHDIFEHEDRVIPNLFHGDVRVNEKELLVTLRATLWVTLQGVSYDSGTEVCATCIIVDTLNRQIITCM